RFDRVRIPAARRVAPPGVGRAPRGGAGQGPRPVAGGGGGGGGARGGAARAAGAPYALVATTAHNSAGGRAAATVSEQAVQVLGAAGCAPDSRVGRFYRDAKVMQIIEGAQEVAEVTIGERVLRGGAW
uniref:acyl-CoA dehydrogenase family protein n=1 Tax=Nocardia wallacei TaxID=480035 RepID=UPI0024540361